MDAVDWEALKIQVSNCRKCAIRSGCKQTVFGDGNVAAPILMVGEAPGEKEDLEGLPFIGPAGAMLRKCMVEAELDPEWVFVVNALKCRPPADRAPLKGELGNCVPYLFKQIEYVKPKLVVALGGVAAQLLLVTRTPISKLRERFHRRLGYTVLPTFHPSYILRSESALVKAQVVADLKAARKFVEAMREKDRAAKQETEADEDGLNIEDREV